jgi:hypothetical protein
MDFTCWLTWDWKRYVALVFFDVLVLMKMLLCVHYLYSDEISSRIPVSKGSYSNTQKEY